jgi:hypothetical protein
MVHALAVIEEQADACVPARGEHLFDDRQRERSLVQNGPGRRIYHVPVEMARRERCKVERKPQRRCCGVLFACRDDDRQIRVCCANAPEDGERWRCRREDMVRVEERPCIEQASDRKLEKGAKKRTIDIAYNHLNVLSFGQRVRRRHIECGQSQATAATANWPRTCPSGDYAIHSAESSSMQESRTLLRTSGERL